jgi:hypothetical protein
MASTKSDSNQSERIMKAKKKFENEWKEATKLFGTPEDTLGEGSAEENASGCPLRRETSLGGTIREYYADGSEKQPDNPVAKPIALGRRLYLGASHPAQVEGLVNLHHLYREESERLNATFTLNSSTPQAVSLSRAALRALPEE